MQSFELSFYESTRLGELWKHIFIYRHKLYLFIYIRIYTFQSIAVGAAINLVLSNNKLYEKYNVIENNIYKLINKMKRHKCICRIIQYAQHSKVLSMAQGINKLLK